MNSEATGLITIVKLPRGEVPEEIRQEWIGLTLACYPVTRFITDVEVGFVSGRPHHQARRCVIVPQKEALQVLAVHKPAVAKWWYDHGFPAPFAPNFSFGEDEIRVVTGVRQEHGTRVTEEMPDNLNK